MSIKFNNTAAVILAGGYGRLDDTGRSKLDYTIGGVPMIVRVVSNVLSAGEFDEVAIVINPLYGKQLKQTLRINLLEEDFAKLKFYEQEKRTGTAGAVAITLPHLPVNVNDIFVMFGDMPLWRPTTIRSLVDCHNSENTAITLGTLEVPESDPAHVYGRIIRHSNGSIAEIIEPGYSNLPPIAFGSNIPVNPSLYMFTRWFLRDHIGFLKPHDKGDGYEHELWLPDLIAVADRSLDPMVRVAEIQITDVNEARGVNTAEELEIAEKIFSRRKN